MTRKKLNIIISLSLLAIYAGSFYFILNSCKNSVYESFSNSCDALSDTLARESKKMSEGEYGDIDFYNFVNGVYDDFTGTYPLNIALYSMGDSPKLIAKSSSHVTIYDNTNGTYRRVDISPYLTDKMKKDINIYNLGYGCVDASEFSFNKSGDKIIPVSLSFNSWTNKKSITWKFSDEKAKYTYQINDTNYSLLACFDPAFSIPYNTKKQRKTSESLLSSSEVEKIRKLPLNEISGGNTDGEKAEYFNVFKYKDKYYYLVAVMRQNAKAGVLTSDEFITELQFFTELYVVASVLIFVFSNKLFLKNKRLDESRRAFISAAAHELKTPITIIENRSEFIVENVNPDKNEEYIKSIYEESRRMDALVKELLCYNRITSLKKIKLTDCDLSEIVNSEIKKYEPAAAQKDIQIITNIQDGVIIKAESELIALAVDNYLSNAFKHTEKGKSVIVTLNKARFSVFNEGEQIKKEDANIIFDEFFKTDKARTGDGSSGIGLAVTRKIFELHKMKYGFNNKTDGVEFYCEF